MARHIAADHKDLIHDVSFDFHGRRMATCSSDQSVKVCAEPWGGTGPRKGGSENVHDSLLERSEPRLERGLPADFEACRWARGLEPKAGGQRVCSATLASVL